MNQDVFIFEVSQQSFGQSVLLNSHKLPVIVEFMGVWSEPCVLMADLFSQLAKEFAGQFIFAKVDIDEQKELAEEYDIKNMPTLLVFKDGEPVRTEVGQLQEVEARQLLTDFGVYRESDLIREQARDKHLSGETHEAVLMLTDAIKNDPSNTRIAMDMVQIFLDMGEFEQAKALYHKLPESDKNTEMGKQLTGQLTFNELALKTDGIATLTEKLEQDSNNHNARFDLAVCLIAQHQYEEAIENLFIILQNDADFKEGAVREMVITVCNMLAPVNYDLTQSFRQKLANYLT